MKKVRAFHGTEVVNLGGAVTQCTKRTRRKRSPNKFRTTSPTTIFLPVTYPPTRCLIVSFFPLLQRSTIEGLFEGKVSSHFPAFFRFLGCQVTRTHTHERLYIYHQTDLQLGFSCWESNCSTSSGSRCQLKFRSASI